MKEKLESIQLLRGAAALLIVFDHADIFSFGNGFGVGVDLFFVISGFIMMYVTAKKDMQHFLVKRIVRIVPLYWLATILWAIALAVVGDTADSGVFSSSDYVKSLLFLPLSTTGTAVSKPAAVLRTGWSLVYEMYFYVIFFIAARINHKHRAILATIILGGVVVVKNILNSENIYLNYYGRTLVFEFSLGMLAYHILFEMKKSQTKKKGLEIIYIAAIIASTGFAISFPNVFPEIIIETVVPRIMYFGLPMLIVFICTFKLFEAGRVPRVGVMIGDMSYSIYLLHLFVYAVFRKLVFTHFEPSCEKWLTVLVIPVIIGVSYVSWYLFENGLTHFLRAKLRC